MSEALIQPTLVVLAAPEAVISALARVCGLHVGPGPVAMWIDGGLVAIAGLDEPAAMAVGDALDVEAAAVGMLDDADEDIGAATRSASGFWHGAGGAAYEILFDWTDGEVWRYAKHTPMPEAVLGSALISDAGGFEGEPRSFRFEGSTAAAIKEALAAIAQGASWSESKVLDRDAIDVNGTRVFPGPGDLQRARDATPKPPGRDLGSVTATLGPPGRFSIDDGSGPLVWGRHRDEGSATVIDARSRLESGEVEELVREVLVARHRDAFAAEVLLRHSGREVDLSKVAPR